MVNSMTGFARLTQQTNVAQITIELKAVNHRFLDIGLSLPDTFSQLDHVWRNLLREKLGRGRIDGSLRIQWQSPSQQNFPLDQALLQQLLTTLSHLKKLSPELATPSSLEVLKWPGVVSQELNDVNALQQIILEALPEAINILIDQREQEGLQIKRFIEQRLQKITEISQLISTELPKLIESQQQRIIKKFEEVKVQLDPERLAQEMVLFTQRLDVAEELDRLNMHLQAVQNLLNEGGRIGRKLDFMMQELNREANTLGSKSFSANITQQVVNMKVCIEEMREQIQNIE